MLDVSTRKTYTTHNIYLIDIHPLFVSNTFECFRLGNSNVINQNIYIRILLDKGIHLVSLFEIRHCTIDILVTGFYFDFFNSCIHAFRGAPVNDNFSPFSCQ
ncbi:hypothetical protein D3C84_939860 [compost metagenome]